MDVTQMYSQNTQGIGYPWASNYIYEWWHFYSINFINVCIGYFDFYCTQWQEGLHFFILNISREYELNDELDNKFLSQSNYVLKDSLKFSKMLQATPILP